MKTVRLLMIPCLIFVLASCSKSAQKPNQELEQRVENLLSAMTLEEKIGQMNQLSPSADVAALHEVARKGQVGSLLNLVDPAAINAVQRVAVEESRLGIPILIARDVIHGFKTIFPIPLGQAATFNPELVEQGARISAIEATAAGIRWTFSPMIDVARDPRWGRVAEGSGEDTYLTSVMGVAMIKGYQSDALNNPTAMAACPKHFVGYAAAEGGRDYASTFIPERLLRNVYLPPFEAAAYAGAATYMTSFNDNDGVPSTGNSFILKDVLRDEWNFDGFVVTDWASAAEMIPHGFVADRKEAALKSVNAGVDMEMVSETFVDYLPELIKEGKVSMKTIDNAVRNILRIKFRLGLFEQPYVDENQPSVNYAEAHLEAAKQAAVESTILLKNDNQTLPLSEKVKTIAIVGPMANAPYDQLGTWVFDGEKEHTQTPLAAFREMYGEKVRVIYEPGLAYSRDTDKNSIRKAVSAASAADVILAFVGEESILSGEAHCLANLNLQGAQSELIAQLAALKKPLITVVMAGRPLTIAREVELSSAVLYMFHPGTMGGPAVADLLFGKETPSGKTPITFPKEVGQIPMYYAHNNSGRPATRQETLLTNIPLEAGQTSLGNTSFYLDAGFDPLFPFGYGLSYTTFEYSNVKLSAAEYKQGETISVTFSIKNTGQYAGTEVAQLYVRDLVGSVTRPVKELKRFNRISLNPGEEKQVTFELPVSELAFWNIDMVKMVEPGDFLLWIAGDSQSGDAHEFKVVG